MTTGAEKTAPLPSRPMDMREVRALGRALAIATPATDAIYTVLKLHRLGI
jgi:hypothetical protein